MRTPSCTSEALSGAGRMTCWRMVLYQIKPERICANACSTVPGVLMRTLQRHDGQEVNKRVRRAMSCHDGCAGAAGRLRHKMTNIVGVNGKTGFSMEPSGQIVRPSSGKRSKPVCSCAL